MIANNIGGSLTDLDNFTRGQGSLKPEVLQLLARELYDSNYDAERDLLVRPRPPAQVLCTAYPPPAAETKLDLSWRPGPQPAKPEPPKPDPRHRPGWATE